METARGVNNGLDIKEAYERAVDEDVLRFVKDVLADQAQLAYVTVAFLGERAADEIRALTGKEVTGARVVLDANAVRHIQNRHGSVGEHDQSMADPKNLARLGYIISNFDEIELSNRRSLGIPDENNRPSPLIVIKKRINGTYYVIEAVNSAKKKRSQIVSAYIKKRSKKAAAAH